MTQGVSLAVLTSLLASTAAAAAKLLSADYSPWLIIWVQYLICTVMMTPSLLRQGVSLIRTERLNIHIIRSLAGWLGFTCYYLALPLIPLVDAALLRSAAPLWVPAVVWIGFSEQIPLQRWIALIIGFVGVFLVLNPTYNGLSLGHLIGMGAGLSLALSMATTRSLSSSEPAARVLFYYFFISTLASTPMAMANLSNINSHDALIFLWVGVSIFFTMILYNRAFSLAPTSIIAPLSYVGVPAAACLDWLFWGHLPGAMTISGSLLVILGGILAVTLSGRTNSRH